MLHIYYALIYDGHLGYFPVLAIVNNTIINMRVQKSHQHSHFVSFNYVPKSRIAESYGGSIFYF